MAANGTKPHIRCKQQPIDYQNEYLLEILSTHPLRSNLRVQISPQYLYTSESEGPPGPRVLRRTDIFVPSPRNLGGGIG